MAGAVGIHPIVVLGSVIVGSKVAGIPGAIFGIPIAAVLSAFFFHWFERAREGGSVADRATKRVQAREGHPIRRPQEPVPGVDEDVEEVRERRRGHAPELAGPLQAHPLTPSEAEALAAEQEGLSPPEIAPVVDREDVAEVVPEAEAEAGTWRKLDGPDDLVEFYDPTDVFGDLADTLAEAFPALAEPAGESDEDGEEGQASEEDHGGEGDDRR
jgi:hypothetical protein